MPLRQALPALILAAVLAAPAGAAAQPAADRVRALLARYDEDPRRIDQARDLVEEALARERPVALLALAARVHFLVGDVRATTPDDKLAAYARGRELGQRAVELAPRSEDAHLWYAINTGRWGQTKGVLRSLFLLPTMFEELETIFAINPRSVRGHALAGNVYFEVPPLFGGDRKKAEQHYRKGLEIEPRFTVLRVDLARLLIATGRVAEARRELARVVEETAPASRADWTVKDRPRARELLESLKAP
ncbi:MAG: tetratricopeptide repeat protein [Candidatus Rokuibacteriota bacterium]